MKIETINCEFCERKTTQTEKGLCHVCVTADIESAGIHEAGEFVITKNHLENAELLTDTQLVCFRAAGYTEEMKLYDDDDTLYFSALIHKDVEDEFCALDWATYDSGCTYATYLDKHTNTWKHL
mgnify:CR=1 FL=1|tara:strand:+ start:439 stop:810 length:372 start_codon:yes stop_codon:yes gene_type:complete